MRFKKRLTLLLGLAIAYYFFFYDPLPKKASRKVEHFETQAKEYTGEDALVHGIDTSDGKRVFNLHLLPTRRYVTVLWFP